MIAGAAQSDQPELLALQPAQSVYRGPVEVGETDAAAVGIVLDEHLLTDPKRDMDYNGGGEVTLSGARALHKARWFDGILGAFDRAVGIRESGTLSAPAHALSFGLLIFTPSDLRDREPVIGDRPYASLFFLSAGRRYVTADGSTAYDSSFTVGALGLAAARAVQDVLHDATGSIRPEGWGHQISSGGEPTALYSIAREALLGEVLDRGTTRADVKWTLAASAGTVTEGSLALNARWGRIASPWWAFTPEQSTYVDNPRPAPPRLAAHSPPELFVLVGARCKLRAYNAFLQGQFRHSDLRYSTESLNQVLGEAWAGVEFRTAAGLELRYLARWQSPELHSGVGSRTIVWGSFEVAKSFQPH